MGQILYGSAKTTHTVRALIPGNWASTLKRLLVGSAAEPPETDPRPSLYRCLQRHGISHLPESEGNIQAPLQALPERLLAH